MKIKDILAFIGVASDDSREIEKIEEDLSSVDKTTCFLAINGHHYTTKRQVKEAKKYHCPLILADQKIRGAIYVKDLKKRVFDICSYFYHLDLSELHLIAITGTNGKTSLAHLLVEALEFYKKKVALISTVRYDEKTFMSDLTTPRASKIAYFFYEAIKRQDQYLVMEVSSIAYKEERVNGIRFDTIFLTNLESDHLDYHQTIEAYHQAKLDFISSNPHGKLFYSQALKKELNGIKVPLPNVISASLSLTEFIFQNCKYKTKLSAISLINISLLIAFLQRENFIDIKKCVSNLKPIKGRMNLVYQKPYIVIDYAHTESSFKAVLSCLKRIHQGKMTVIFGAGGERDTTKRKRYGNLALEYADKRIVTDDNPRNEDPQKIVDDIVDGHQDSFIIIHNRKTAIKYALDHATADELVVILGKGVENYSIIGNRKVPYSDYKEVESWISDKSSS